MEWTKFKKDLPNDAYVWITDWVSTWPSFFNTGSGWRSYAKENPEYGWAKMESPPTPLEPLEFHICFSLPLGLHRCFEDVNGLWFGGPNVNDVKIKYCPFCGYKP